MRRITARTAALSGAAVLALGGAAAFAASPDAPAAPVAAAPAPTTTSAPAVPTTQEPPQPVETPSATLESSIHLRIDDVDLDLPVLPLNPSKGAINPPTMGEAYWIQPYGDPVGDADDAQNTLYIAAHSWGRGDAAFNPLLDEDHQGAAVEPGDVLEVVTPEGTVDYTVERTARYAKGALASATDVWEVSPGRLVLITCFQRDDGRSSTENLVVFAES